MPRHARVGRERAATCIPGPGPGLGPVGYAPWRPGRAWAARPGGGPSRRRGQALPPCRPHASRKPHREGKKKNRGREGRAGRKPIWGFALGVPAPALAAPAQRALRQPQTPRHLPRRPGEGAGHALAGAGLGRALAPALSPAPLLGLSPARALLEGNQKKKTRKKNAPPRPRAAALLVRADGEPDPRWPRCMAVCMAEVWMREWAWVVGRARGGAGSGAGKNKSEERRRRGVGAASLDLPFFFPSLAALRLFLPVFSRGGRGRCCLAQHYFRPRPSCCCQKKKKAAVPFGSLTVPSSPPPRPRPPPRPLSLPPPPRHPAAAPPHPPPPHSPPPQ